MGAILQRPHDRINSKTLLDMYKLFCDAYGVKTTEDDTEAVRTEGPKLLKKCSRYDRSHPTGVIFFVRGMHHSTLFSGYTPLTDRGWETKDFRFRRYAKQYAAGHGPVYVHRK